MARYLLELSLLEGQCVVFLPMHLAGATLCLSRQVLQEPLTAEGEAAWCLASSIHVGRWAYGLVRYAFPIQLSCIAWHWVMSSYPQCPFNSPGIIHAAVTDLTSRLQSLYFPGDFMSLHPSSPSVWHFACFVVSQWGYPAEDHAHPGQCCSQSPHARDLCYFY